MSDINPIYKITPLPQQRLWGTERLSQRFYPRPVGDPYGEIFLCSAMADADSLLGKTSFRQFYHDHRETHFGIKNNEFPLRVNLIETASALSIQVHPDHRITQSLGYPQGVHEFWLILDHDQDSSIELGHCAPNKASLNTAIQEGTLSDYLINRPVKTNEFFYLPPGTLHAIGKGLTVYELTYNLDITYRVYDYDRIQASTGQKRKLHVEEALEVITYPQNPESGCLKTSDHSQNPDITVIFDKTDVFTLQEWKISGSAKIDITSFFLITIIEGQGTINAIMAQPYDTFLIPKNCPLISIVGDLRILAATYHEKG